MNINTIGLFILIMMSIRSFSSFITKNKTHCMNCVNYIKYKYTYPEDEIYERKTTVGNCSLFGKQDLITGEINYEDALICRMHESKCGIKGVHFVEKRGGRER